MTIQRERSISDHIDLTRPTLPRTIPPGSTLLHIGFPKTGTTSVQWAFAASREDLVRNGVLYPGRAQHHKQPAIAVVGATPRIGERPPRRNAWPRLVRQVRASHCPRVLVSSEWLSEADDKAVDRITSDLDKPFVAATLRPLSKILPAAWQQYVQSGMRTSYDDWLKAMLIRSSRTKLTPTFWRRQRHDVILRRWTDAIGPERMTAIVLDETDHTKVFRQFEALLGLPPDTLPSLGRRNRSLSPAEAEVLREMNTFFKSDEVDWSPQLYHSVIRSAVALAFTAQPRTSPDAVITTPQWALDRAAEIGSEIAATLRSLDIEIVGDVDSLAARDIAAASPPPMLLSPQQVSGALREAIDAAVAQGVRKGERRIIPTDTIKSLARRAGLTDRTR